MFLLAELVTVSASLAATRSRKAKTALLAHLLRALPRDEIAIGVSYLTGEIPGGRLGLGPAQVNSVRVTPPAVAPTLDLATIQSRLMQLKELRGGGSAGGRRELLADLYRLATDAEQDFLSRLLLGELRQGALDGVMVSAIAGAANVAEAVVRRAAMLAGSLASVADAALTAGEAGLGRFVLHVHEPVQPMLASPAADMAEALKQLGRASLEYKLDGARVQIHKAETGVRVFSRSLREVTTSVPEIVEWIAALAARTLILDGEVLALDRAGRPHPFQMTMSRFGRKLDVRAGRARLPLSLFAFDCLHLDGTDLIDRPYTERVARLAAALPAEQVVPRITTADVAEAVAFFQSALAAGHEGVMAKAPDAFYEAGSRGSNWLKIKQAVTLDLVVLAAEWGSGRRSGWLSNLHLGARDERGGYVMLGKTFKGLTDELLAWQTQAFLERETGRDGHVVHVRPELVVEIEFNELQSSVRYPGGLALRFARVLRYRPDKAAAEADTMDTVRKLARGAGERAS